MSESKPDLKWYVIHSHAQKEDTANLNLLNQGYTSYLPKYKKLRSHARKTDIILAPLFPRYLFVNLDLTTTPWYKINNTRGVAQIITNEAKMPIALPDNVIEELKQQEEQQGVVSLSSLALFSKGDKLKIIQEGAFKDQNAIFLKMAAKDRVELLIKLLQQNVKVTMPIHSIEKI